MEIKTSLGKMLSTGDKPRDVRIDAMRVFTMLFIVMHHLVTNVIPFSSMQNGVDFGALDRYLTVALWDGFWVIGVNVFFAASGFCSMTLKPRKMISLLVKVYVYWLVGMLLQWAVAPDTYQSVLSFLWQFIIAIARYWFVLVYMLLMLLAPVLNKFAEYLAAKSSRVGYFVFISTLFFCIVGFISDNIYPYMGTDKGYTVIWAAVPYLYGRLIRLKQDRLRSSVGFWALVYVAATLLNFAMATALICTDNGGWAVHCYTYNNPLVLVSSLAFMLMFVSASPTESPRFYRLLSLVATHTLGVYLVHSNNPFLHRRRAFLMDMVGPLWAKFLLLPVNAMLLLVIGVLVDILYEWLLGRPVAKMAQCVEKGILFVYNKGMDALRRSATNKKATPPPEGED